MMRNGLRVIAFIALFLLIMSGRVYAAAVHIGFLRVILTATAVPGGDKLSYFTRFSVPSTSQGRVAFYGIDNRNRGGVYNNLYNYLQLVADSRTTLPGNRSRFNGFKRMVEMGSVPLINHRMIIFQAQDGLGRPGIYRFFSNKLSLIVGGETPMPGNKQATFQRFTDPWLLDDASVVFIGRSGNDLGIFGVDRAGRLLLLMNANKTTIPQGKGTFTAVRDLAMSPNSGQQNYAFIGEGRTEAPQPYGIKVKPSQQPKKVPLKQQEVGIYMSRPLANGKVVLEKIADKNTKIPEGLGYFVNFSHLGFEKNQMVFIGSGILGEQGVYMSVAKGQLVKIADLKMIAPQGESQFSRFDKVLLRNGTVIFHAQTKDKMQGLFLYTPQYGLFKLLSSRDQVDNKAISDAQISRDSLSGQNLGILVTFKNGAQAVYVCTIKISSY